MPVNPTREQVADVAALAGPPAGGPLVAQAPPRAR